MMGKFFTKKNIFRSLLIFVFIGCGISIYVLSTDDYADGKFRTMQDSISGSEKVDLRGLRELQASAGPMPDFVTLQKKLSPIKKQVVIVNLMMNDQGYVNHVPATFLGYHRDENELRYLLRRLFVTGSFKKLPEKIQLESQVASQYGFKYINFKINSRHYTDPKIVDRFVSYFDTLPENVWIHFHCRHGKGRTSMALVMYDIVKNAPRVALEDIMKRQHLIGSVDLNDTDRWKYGTYSSRALRVRKQFIKDFYAFINQRKAGGKQNWSEWIHHEKETNTSRDS